MRGKLIVFIVSMSLCMTALGKNKYSADYGNFVYEPETERWVWVSNSNYYKYKAKEKTKEEENCTFISTDPNDEPMRPCDEVAEENQQEAPVIPIPQPKPLPRPIPQSRPTESMPQSRPIPIERKVIKPKLARVKAVEAKIEKDEETKQGFFASLLSAIIRIFLAVLLKIGEFFIYILKLLEG